jgi:hypothetical protein
MPGGMIRLNGGSFDGEKRLIYRTKLTSNETDLANAVPVPGSSCFRYDHSID